MKPSRGVTAWPMPLLSVVLPAAAIMAVVASGLVGLFDRPVGWPRVSAAVHDQLLLAGPIATMASFFYCANLAGRRALLALPTATRVGHVSVLRSFRLLWTWMLSAYLLPFVPLFGYLTARATYGGIDVLAALAGPVGMGLAVALGCALGTALPNPVLAPAAAVLVFLLFQLPNVAEPAAAAFVPTLGHSPVTLGEAENPLFVAYRLVAMLVLTASALGVAGLVARRVPPREFVSWRTAGALSAVVVLLAVPLTNPPRAVIAEDAPPRACRSVEGVEVCLHEGHRGMLDTAVPVVRALVDAYGGRPDHLTAVHGTGLNTPDHATVAEFTPYTTGPLESSIALSVSVHLAGLGSCHRALRSGRISYPQYQARSAERYPLASWLRRQAGVSGERVPASAGGFLDGAEAAQVRSWLAAQERRLAHCEPLPGVA
ncbi:hypothetical protein B0I33_102503 [Prauserella shujinwangii]|uniref:Uncharacterized protein n=1 Tax=Prauserella shujinwangii TaxID=1453103 RepID=A0A2T0M197_9PSEU|nr:hypothetical protein [Prauserella shujinwangii]PRX50382.1 hypothetical protein B0I33_102503 [Prauserella shujinwangii]